MFVSNDIKDMAKFRGDLRQWRAQVHVVCAVLQFLLWYKALTFVRKEGTIVPENILARAGMRA